MKSYLINTETLEYPIYEGDYRLKFSDTSFPQDFEPDTPYAWVYETTPPTLTSFETNYREITPVQNASGKWERQWEVYTLSQEEFLAKEERAEEANKNLAVRLLRDTDWSQLPDVNLQNKQAFVEYRALLRDIVLNPQREVVFPTKPIEVW